MRRVRAGGYRRARTVAVSGVAFAYFSLLGLPILFFGAGLATDFTRIIVSSRQVANASEAAALAGAQQFAPDSAALDPYAAVAKATETYCYAQDAGVMTLSQPTAATVACPGGGSASITVTPVATGWSNGTPMYTEVDVRATYQVKGLVFARFFGQGEGYEGRPITRTAAVCVPTGDNEGPTGGFCSHPTNADPATH